MFFAIQQFRPYIEGYNFTVMTDISLLLVLFRQENSPGRLAEMEWNMYLSQYSIDLVQRKSSANVMPDTR